MAARRLWVRASIDALHALSAGLVPGAAVALWVARTSARTTLDPIAFSELTRTWTPVLLVPLFAIAMLVVTGLARLGHRTTHVVPEAVGPKARAALAEHGVFVVLFAVATASLFVMVQP